MKSLTLDSFISSDEDIEINQYRILSGLKEYSNEFNRNKLYPSLSELVFLASQLEQVLHKKSSLSLTLPKGIKGGTPGKDVFVELVEENAEKKNYLFDLIDWAIPVIKELIHEAYILYDYVDESIKISRVGISSLFKNEGYMFVQDNKNSKLHIYRYECADYSTSNKPFYSLKTKYIESAQPITHRSQAEYLKSELVRKFQIPANTTVFLCATDSDFPYSESVFPIAKRKLLGLLSDLL